ncbi:hypothetical protein [Psychrobacter sp.]
MMVSAVAETSFTINETALANQGDTDAQHYQASMYREDTGYREGTGVDQDSDKAHHWSQKAARQNDNIDMYIIEDSVVETCPSCDDNQMDSDSYDPVYQHDY